MEGSGVTNYAVDRPSFAFTASTTEFDDALIRRKVIQKEDAIVAKGASREHARMLLASEMEGTGASAGDGKVTPNELRGNVSQRSTSFYRGSTLDSPAQHVAAASDDENDVDDDDEFLDDDVLRRYRERRLGELRTTTKPGDGGSNHDFGEVVYISRPEWARHVNDASARGWVVVCLTSSDTERTGAVEAACRHLAALHPRTKFVFIPSHSAIPNWPDDNLPSLFLYRDGTMQHQLVQLPSDLSFETLEGMLHALSVLESDC